MTQNAINNTGSILDIDNIRLDGNTISSTDSNGNIVLTPDGTGDIVTGTTGTDNVVSMLRSAEGQWFGMDDQTDAFGVYNSSGDPDGVIAADIGSLATDTTNGVFYIKQTDTVNTGWTEIGGHSGSVVQTTSSTTSAPGSTTAIIPLDNTIPQITEGASYMTHVHTPLSAANILFIEFLSWGTNAAAQHTTVALFRQGTANAIVAIDMAAASINITGTAILAASQVSGVTTPITFEVRWGSSGGGACTLNAAVGGGHLYGAAGVATFRVTERIP